MSVYVIETTDKIGRKTMERAARVWKDGNLVKNNHVSIPGYDLAGVRFEDNGNCITFRPKGSYKDII